MNRKRKFSSSQNNDQPRKRARTNGHGANTNGNRNNSYSSISASPSLSSSTFPFKKPNFNPNYDSENIERPKISITSFNTSQKLCFQQIDTDYYIGFDPISSQRSDERSKRAIIRLYGVTQSGESVLCHCIGFAPYFYCQTWHGFQKGDEEKLRNALNNRMLQNESSSKHKCNEYVTKIVLVEKQSIWGYNFGQNKRFLKIYTALPTLVPTIRRIIIDGVRLTPYDQHPFRSTTYESNIAFILRYMIDRNIVGAGWIGVDGGRYHIVPQHKKSSNCTLEIVTRCDSVNGIDCKEMEEIAPLRILSFDIECMCTEGFPEATNKANSVIQISNVCYIQGSEHKKKEESKKEDDGDIKMDDQDPSISISPNPDQDVYFHKSVFCLNSCSPIAGAKVYCYETEKEMLREWAKFVRKLDPDILTGYNIVNFDLPYLIERAKVLSLPNFSYLGRQKNARSVIKESSFSSRAYGASKSKDINISGRVQMDLLPIIRRDHKLRSYSLNAVSFHFLKSQKEDVHYSIIGDLQNGTDETRRRLAVYCLKDSVLPLKLIKKLQTTINLIEMARVTGVPINFLITRGQQIKVLSQLYRTCRGKNIIIPYMPYDREANAASGDGVGYEGATVIEPKRGYYTEPITTLDFASLYPSIMIAHNLCYTTMINKKDAEERLKSDQYTKSPNNNQDYFVKADVQKGVLPEILEHLLSERKKVKKMMKNLAKQGKKDTMLYAVYNGRQLALKISANSVYGFTGATVGALPCLKISAAVTSFGRDMIHDTKEFIEQQYSRAQGFVCDAQIVYGDTDSVMIKFGEKSDNITMEQAMEFGKKAAEMVTKKLFIKPIMLEFEKVYQPYLLMNKKRYAGMLWTNCKKWDYMDAKGIETVRRDNCPLTKNLVQSVLNYILIHGDVTKAVEYTKNVISKLLQNKIDLSSLIVTKKLNKIEDYKVKAAHVELVHRMRKRGDTTQYKTGDRVSYVITKGSKKAKAYEKAEDPLYALENGVAIDTDYYLKNQLEQPLTRIFDPILGENGVKQLFHGEHTRIIKVSTSNVGAMMCFVVKKKTCIGCKCILKKHESKSSVCSKCKSKESQLYMKQMAVVRKNEKKFHKLWTQCQRCQGSLTQEVLCSNRDCPIFYKRTKVRKDLEEAQKILSEFSF